MFQDRVNVCVTLRVPNASRLWHVFSIHGKKFSELCLEKMWLNYNVSGGGGGGAHMKNPPGEEKTRAAGW